MDPSLFLGRVVRGVGKVICMDDEYAWILSSDYEVVKIPIHRLRHRDGELIVTSGERLRFTCGDAIVETDGRRIWIHSSGGLLILETRGVVRVYGDC